MYRSELKVGDRVVATSDFDGMKITGEIGTVLAVPKKTNVPVEFDNDIGGHDCNGKGEDGFCFYVSPWALRRPYPKKSVETPKRSAEKQATPVVAKHTVVIIRENKNSSRKAGGIMTKLSNMARKLLDKDLAALVEVGYMDAELNITPAGADAAITAYFLENKKVLATEAAAILKKRNKNCKDKDEDTEDAE